MKEIKRSNYYYVIDYLTHRQEKKNSNKEPTCVTFPFADVLKGCCMCTVFHHSPHPHELSTTFLIIVAVRLKKP